MEVSNILFNSDTKTYEVKSENGKIATHFVFSPWMKKGDRLPPLHMVIWGDKVVFSFNGVYNVTTDNLEFFVEGPVGYIYKGSLQLDPALRSNTISSGYSWKIKRHGHTRTGRDHDCTQFFVPRSICVAATTTITSETVVKHWTLYGQSVPRKFARLGLKLAFWPARCSDGSGNIISDAKPCAHRTNRTNTLRGTMTHIANIARNPHFPPEDPVALTHLLTCRDPIDSKNTQMCKFCLEESSRSYKDVDIDERMCCYCFLMATWGFVDGQITCYCVYFFPLCVSILPFFLFL